MHHSVNSMFEFVSILYRLHLDLKLFISAGYTIIISSSEPVESAYIYMLPELTYIQLITMFCIHNSNHITH